MGARSLRLTDTSISSLAKCGFDHENRNHRGGKGWICLCSRRGRTRQRPDDRDRGPNAQAREGGGDRPSLRAPLCPKTSVVDGDYDDLADSELVMITSGINEKAG